MSNEGRQIPPIRVHILGSRDNVSRLVVALRQVVDVTYTTPAYPADPPYEVHRYVGASGLRMTGLASVVAEINATVTSYTRGNLNAEDAMERIRQHLARYDKPRRRNSRRRAGDPVDEG
jgi:hypothetical protein